MVGSIYHHYNKSGWYLEAALAYCDAVKSLNHELDQDNIHSKGLIDFRKYLRDYATSPTFIEFCATARQLKKELSAIQYSILINGSRVSVSEYSGETDYSVEIEAIFEKFKQGAVKDYKIPLPTGTTMNLVEEKILDRVAKLFPEIFARLDDFVAQYQNFVDELLSTFDREVQFYLSYWEHIHYIQGSGLSFCFPKVSNTSKNILSRATFDLALANALIHQREPVICNDFFLQDPERILIITGPNQGGKTTFARTVGQLHYLASLGLLVPGERADLYLCDNIFTHFEQEEDIRRLSGKLMDDLIRIQDILNQATGDSLVIINEIFTSTMLEDAVFLSKKILEKIMDLDALCVCVTFIDELATLSKQTVSMVSTVDNQNPDIRTFKILRKEADGLAYALSIAEKYGLTYRTLKGRLIS